MDPGLWALDPGQPDKAAELVAVNLTEAKRMAQQHANFVVDHLNRMNKRETKRF